MFNGKLGSLRHQLADELRHLMMGYIDSTYKFDYKNPDDAQKFVDTMRQDQYMEYLAEQVMQLEKGAPTVVDFSTDLVNIHKAFTSWDSFMKFRETVITEVEQDYDLPLVFNDILIPVGNMDVEGEETGQGLQLENVILHVTNVTPIWGDDEYHRVIQLNVYHMIPSKKSVDGEVLESSFVCTAAPIHLLRLKEGGLMQTQPSNWDAKAKSALYGGTEDELRMLGLDGTFNGLMMYVFGCFQFMYRHQKISYREVETPTALNRKRAKKNKVPFERYFVSRLGDFTRTTYTESNSKKRGEDGRALHIRRGHWRLKWGHRKLPASEQERVWIESTVAGDPQYGIIIRDYETDLINDEVIDELAEKAGS